MCKDTTPKLNFNNIYCRSIALRKDSETDVVGKLRTPLDNETPHPFWLSWTDNIIEVGEGHRFGERVVVTGTKAIGYEVKAISFETDEYETEVKMDMESGTVNSCFRVNWC